MESLAKVEDDHQGLSPATNKGEFEHLIGRPVRSNKIFFAQTEEEREVAKSEREEGASLEKSMLRLLNGTDKKSVERLAFEVDPSQVDQYSAIYLTKKRGIPTAVLKRLIIQDDLVAAILNARASHLSAFGRPRPDRFSTGYSIEPDAGYIETLSLDKRDEFKAKVKAAIDCIATCGSPDGLEQEDRYSFSQWLEVSVKNALGMGMISTEIVRDDRGRFHSFRYIDAGTIYRATYQKSQAQLVRESAKQLLEQLKGKELVSDKFDPKKFEDDQYAWIQVQDGRILQAFTNKECIVKNFYPVADIEMAGYPVTPLDNVLSAVTTHINISTHNKLYFQSGRAARGMLIIKSDDVDESVIGRVKQQFNASINSVDKSWRMPVFAIGQLDDIKWQPIDSGGGKDMEFQYLADMNARVILSAFQISPDELTGYSYLSRGTANQSLAECIDGASNVITSDGMIEIGRLVGASQEVEGVFWTGTEWKRGRAFRSGPKALRETELDCGVKLRTSPDHRFLVLGDEGIPVWRHQSELRVGDVALTNATPVAGDEANLPSFRGRRLTLDMAEVLGWITGDGTLVAPRKRTGAQCLLFYHPERESDVWERHQKMLEAFGLKAHHVEKSYTPEERQKQAAAAGVKSKARRQIRNVVYDTEFVNWLFALGFTPSHEGKSLPASLHVWPVEYRAAFLRGLFSADGGKVNKSGSVCLTIQAERIREQVRQLLLGMGIRTLPCKGVERASFGCQKTPSRKLFVKDRRRFWELVGFVQPHKQPDGNVESWQSDSVPMPVRERYIRPLTTLEAFSRLTKRERDNIRGTLGDWKTLRSLTWNKFVALLAQFSVGEPQWLKDYHPERVRAVSDLGTTVDMYDVEVYDETHAFVVDGVVTHNSNTEYKLEAARDVGIRPLLAKFEDFVNTFILPLIDPELAKVCRFKFKGLDADTEEKESVRLQQDIPLHMTYDQVLAKVEKPVVGRDLGGEFPLNSQYQNVLDKYFTVGEILERFMGVDGASQRPELQYRRDPFWFQQVQLLQAQQQAQAQAAQPPTPPPQGGGGQQPDQQPQSDDQQLTQGDQDDGGLDSALDQAVKSLTKAEHDKLPPRARRLLEHQEQAIKQAMGDWEAELREMTKEIVGIADRLSSPRN